MLTRIFALSVALLAGCTDHEKIAAEKARIEAENREGRARLAREIDRLKFEARMQSIGIERSDRQVLEGIESHLKKKN